MFKIEKQDFQLKLTIGYDPENKLFFHATYMLNGKVWDMEDIDESDLNYKMLFDTFKADVERRINWVNNNWLSVEKEEYDILVA